MARSLNTEMPKKPRGQRIEGFSDEDIIEHGHEARRKHQPIWANPFYGVRASLWRKGWQRSQDAVVR